MPDTTKTSVNNQREKIMFVGRGGGKKQDFGVKQKHLGTIFMSDIFKTAATRAGTLCTAELSSGVATANHCCLHHPAANEKPKQEQTTGLA